MKRIFILCAFIGATALNAAAQQNPEVIDRIIAVVGEEVILASELGGQMQMYALQTGEEPKTQTEFDKLRGQILDQMVTDRLFLFEARKDTSISIRPEEIEQALDEQVARIASNFSTNDEFMAALAEEGLTIRELKRKYRVDVENQLLKQRFIQRKLYSVSVSRHEVEEFYTRFQDSIPTQPEGVKLAHALLSFKASPAIEDSVKAFAASLRQQVIDGADFASLSVLHSSFGAGENGGDLGYVGKDEVVPEFSRAAFNLAVGDISGVIRTQFGFHIIKCEAKRDERLKLRHILLGVVPSPADSVATYRLADSLLTAARDGADFAEMAKAFSDDNDTRAQGGELGWFATNQLPKDFADAVQGWKEPGEYRGPVPSQFGLHLLKLLDYQPSKRYSLENDFDRIKELARQDKTGRVVDDWIASIKEKTYVEFRVEK
jgi:peptidyl-prolyl cis-trans isomerase SurA